MVVCVGEKKNDKGFIMSHSLSLTNISQDGTDSFRRTCFFFFCFILAARALIRHESGTRVNKEQECDGVCVPGV